MQRSDDETSGATDASQELDFERADYGTADMPASTGPLTCSICEGPISDMYFTRDGSFVCARCEGPALAAGPPGSSFTRLLGAMAAGTLAAIIASALWMTVTKLTGYEIGLIAIAVGWIVGVAIQLGNRGVGGLPYQLIAVFLTYTAIVMTYVPALATELEALPDGRIYFPEEDDLGPVVQYLRSAYLYDPDRIEMLDPRARYSTPRPAHCRRGRKDHHRIF